MHYTNDMYEVADYTDRMHLRCVPMSADRIAAFLSNLIDKDDWVDIVLLNGTRIRNIQST